MHVADHDKTNQVLFRREVSRAARMYALDAIDRAIEMFVSEGRIAAWDRAACVKLAATLDAQLRREINPKPTTHVRRSRAGAVEAKLRAEEMLTTLEVSVRQLRTEFFGSPEVPFKNLKASADWVKRVAAADHWVHEPAFEAAYRSAKSTLDALNETKATLTYTITATAVPGFVYAESEKGRPFVVRVTKASALARLAHRCKSWSEQTGFPEMQLAALVLCGRTPILRTIWMTRSARNSQPADAHHTSRDVITVELDVRDVNAEQFRLVHTEVRRWLQLDRTKALTADCGRLLKAVQQAGGLPPRRESLKFWREVQTHLPRFKDRSPQAVREAFRRLEDRQRKLSGR